MKKEEVTTKKPENPFAQFSVLKGEFSDENPEKVEDDITDGTEDIIDEEKDNEKAKLEAERIAKGDAELAKVIAKQEKASAKKKKEAEVIDESEDEEITDEDADNTDTSKSSPIKEFIQGLSEKGIIDFDDKDESFTDDEAGIETLINKTVSNRIDKWAKDLPEDFSKMLSFVENGGNPKQFLDIYYGNHSWEEFDIKSEEAQKAAVKANLTNDGYEASEIEDIVTEWSDNGKLEARAKTALNKLQKNESAQKAELLELQKNYADKQKTAQTEYWDTFKNDLTKKEDIKGFKLTPKIKENLWSFMTQVDRKSGKTQYQLATESDGDSSLLFAYLAMNKFDISKLEKQVESKVSSKYAGLLKNYSKTSKERISSGITDDSHDTNPFNGFKTTKT